MPVALHSLDEMVQTAKQQVPEWKSITVEVPRGNGPTVTLSVDTSIGGQPEKAQQLVMNRTTGRADAVKVFSDNVVGRRLRAYARFVHTGEEFGIAGEAVAALASIGAVVLVWTGMSMALRRLLGMAGGKETVPEAIGAGEEELEAETVSL